MPTKSRLERELYDRLLDNYRIAGEETGYWGNYFLRDLKGKGALVTAKKLLQPPRNKDVDSKGLAALKEAHRTDLSVEAVVLEPKFRTLFTKEELAEAQRRADAWGPLPPDSLFPDEVVVGSYLEGRVRQVTVNSYERNKRARAACLKQHGCNCSVCGLNFEARYGEIGKRFIHVHHKNPVALRDQRYKLNPKKDLIPVCPNCHAMLHTHNPPLRVEELRRMLNDTTH
jgi:5-methylcytosine-specific restriction protein A